MDAFSPQPPKWIDTAIHASEFCCPRCKESCTKAQRVWLNRRSPVNTPEGKRKWQEFYQCECECVWWSWSSDRPPSNLIKPDSGGDAESF